MSYKESHHAPPVLDSFDNAMNELGKPGASVEACVSGMSLVQRQFVDVLSKNGLTEIDVDGVDFDPNFHQAVAKISSKDAEKDRVKEQFAKGYKLNNRLIRPAMVSVEVPENNA